MGKFCSKCGAPLKEGAKFCPKCGALVKHADINENSEPAGFFHTAADLDDQPVEVDEPLYENDYGDYEEDLTDYYEEPPKKKKGWLIALICVAVVLCLGGGGAFAAYKFGLFGGDDDTSETADNEPEKTEEAENKEGENKEGSSIVTEVVDESAALAEHQMESELDATVDMTIEPYKESEKSGDEPIGYVDVKTAKIRIRKGPSTSSKDTTKRTAVGDHYEVYEKTTGEGYNWFRISNNNEWIADNNGKWMTFTEYVYEDPAEIDVEYVAKAWYKIYLSYLTSINNNGDFSYLSSTSSDQLATFRENYNSFNKGYNFVNTTFDVDKTDFNVARTGKDTYQAVCHAYVMNTITDKETGNSGDNEVKLIAKLEFDNNTKTWTLLTQRSDKSYNPGTHDMISCGSN